MIPPDADSRDAQTLHPGRLRLYLLLLKVGLAACSRAITYPFLSKGTTAPTFRRDITYAAFRRLFDDLGSDYSQYLNPSTGNVCNDVCTARQQQPDIVTLSHDANVHWLGPRNAQNVMLYFHGGGYSTPSTKAHVEYQFFLRNILKHQGHDLSVLYLEYTLTPHAQFPVQLRQAVAALNYLVKTEGRDPSTIIVAGDSAGANLASALLLHLASPHPTVEPLKLDKKLLGCLLISPWVSFDVKQKSMISNAGSDYLTVPSAIRGAAAFVPAGETSSLYAEPILATAANWTSIADHVAMSVMVWAGADEVLLSSIEDFAAKIKQGFTASSIQEKSVDFCVTPQQAHEQMIIDMLFGWEEGKAASAEIEKWLARILGNARDKQLADRGKHRL